MTGENRGPRRSAAGPDVATIGEALLRLSVRPGDRLEDAAAYEVHVAGSEANVAYALARVGVSSSWTSVLPDSPLGRRVAVTLASGGVDVSTIVWRDNGRIATYFVELGSAPRPTAVVYDRAGSAMSSATPDEFDWDVVCRSRLLHLSGITCALSDGCAAIVERAISEARRHSCRVSLDVNYRQRLWTAEAASRSLRAIAPNVDLLISTAEDARDLFGVSGAPAEAVARFADHLGVPSAVLTLGAEGAVAFHEGSVQARPGYLVEPVDRIGAGDAFTAGLLWGVLEGSIAAGLERGLAMSALKMTLHGDLFRFDAAEVLALIARHTREVRR
ncbi:MAG: sugar kinase [Chloroflexota bacterium]|nr:sugar kinase [Chloroflexota bacterium]